MIISIIVKAMHALSVEHEGVGPCAHASDLPHPLAATPEQQITDVIISIVVTPCMLCPAMHAVPVGYGGSDWCRLLLTRVWLATPFGSHS